MYCLGCGADLSGRVSDRRSLDNLDNSDVRNVVNLWKSFLPESEGTSANIDSICRSGKMCRKCFLAVKNYWHCREQILGKLKSAVDLLKLSAPLPLPPPSKKSKPAVACSSASPDVSVSMVLSNVGCYEP